MRNLLRNNLTIVLSVSLPILVMLLFALATWVPRLIVEDPAHDVVFTRDTVRTRTNSLPFLVDLYVSGGSLHARARVTDSTLVSQPMPRIFVYSAALGTTREVSVEPPDDPGSVRNGEELPLPEELTGLSLSTNLTAPDGWEFDSSRYRGGGLFTELFGGGGRRNEISLRKNGATVLVPVPGDTEGYYQDVRLLGWVIE